MKNMSKLRKNKNKRKNWSPTRKFKELRKLEKKEIRLKEGVVENMIHHKKTMAHLRNRKEKDTTTNHNYETEIEKIVNHLLQIEIDTKEKTENITNLELHLNKEKALNGEIGTENPLAETAEIENRMAELTRIEMTDLKEINMIEVIEIEIATELIQRMISMIETNIVEKIKGLPKVRSLNQGKKTAIKVKTKSGTGDMQAAQTPRMLTNTTTDTTQNIEKTKRIKEEI